MQCAHWGCPRPGPPLCSQHCPPPWVHETLIHHPDLIKGHATHSAHQNLPTLARSDWLGKGHVIKAQLTGGSLEKLAGVMGNWGRGPLSHWAESGAPGPTTGEPGEEKNHQGGKDELETETPDSGQSPGSSCT